MLEKFEHKGMHFGNIIKVCVPIEWHDQVYITSFHLTGYIWRMLLPAFLGPWEARFRKAELPYCQLHSVPLQKFQSTDKW